MRHRPKDIISALVAVLLWTLMAAWLLFLYRSEQRYQDSFFSYLRTHVEAPSYEPPRRIAYRDDNAVVWVGWASPEQGLRWSVGRRSGILFRLSPQAVDRTRELWLRTGLTVGAQPVVIKINDTIVARAVLRANSGLAFGIPKGILQGGSNSIEFQLPEARKPENGDPRTLGFCLAEFWLATDNDSPAPNRGQS